MAKGSTKAPKKRETKIGGVLEKLENSKIAYNEVKTFKGKKPTEEEVIERLSGNDQTKGSCASLALAYAANMAGLDVLDFRGGASQNFFAYANRGMLKNMGGTVEKHTSDVVAVNQLLPTMKEGERYILSTGRHAAVVKRDKLGNAFYLELQDKKDKGWHPLDNKSLRRRFKAQKSHTSYGHKLEASSVLINIKDVTSDSGMQRLLGYINTAKTEQKKGTGGGKK